jgi:hypothetical protein
MPSETPRMPSETHRSLLERGSSTNLGLFAGEVAYYANPKALGARIIRYSRRILFGACTLIFAFIVVSIVYALAISQLH